MAGTRCFLFVGPATSSNEFRNLVSSVKLHPMPYGVHGESLVPPSYTRVSLASHDVASNIGQSLPVALAISQGLAGR